MLPRGNDSVWRFRTTYDWVLRFVLVLGPYKLLFQASPKSKRQNLVDRSV